VLLHGPGVSNPVETNDAANDMLSGAEMPAKDPNQSGYHYYVDGDILTDADVDWWQVPVGTSTQVSVSCSAQRGGSGVRGFEIDVVDVAAPATLISTIIESAFLNASTTYTAMPDRGEAARREDVDHPAARLQGDQLILPLRDPSPVERTVSTRLPVIPTARSARGWCP
jgi:hypothetical protein